MPRSELTRFPRCRETNMWSDTLLKERRHRERRDERKTKISNRRTVVTVTVELMFASEFIFDFILSFLGLFFILILRYLICLRSHMNRLPVVEHQNRFSFSGDTKHNCLPAKSCKRKGYEDVRGVLFSKA